MRISGIVPARFLTIVAHVIILIILFWAKVFNALTVCDNLYRQFVDCYVAFLNRHISKGIIQSCLFSFQVFFFFLLNYINLVFNYNKYGTIDFIAEFVLLCIVNK